MNSSWIFPETDVVGSEFHVGDNIVGAYVCIINLMANIEKGLSDKNHDNT